jgi:hypothetical protein
MADQNNDLTNQAPPASGTQTGFGDGLRSGTPQSGATTGRNSTTESVKESSARIADEARQYANDMSHRAMEKGRSMFEQQKGTAVNQADSVAHAFRNTADQLQGEGKPQVARYIGMVADQIESLGGRLREKDLDALIDDTQDLARRSPGAFFAGTVVAGFLLSRFLKSSADRRRESPDMSRRNWDSSSSAENSGFATTQTGAYGSPSASAAGASLTQGSDMEKTLGGEPARPETGSVGNVAVGTETSNTSPSALTGSKTGGRSYDNR